VAKTARRLSKIRPKMQANSWQGTPTVGRR
jgi:hypothetical protein